MHTNYADLHIHSRYSRATSRDTRVESLALWARLKGLTLVGTGDFTHPAWIAELRDQLLPAEEGLFRLRPDLEQRIEKDLPPACRDRSQPPRFILQSEISTIYKRDGRTRKVHHIILLPGFEAVARLTTALSRIGNLASDGRPILGMDSRDLLETALEASAEALLIPAHIWTPWFSVLGSMSGFDAVEDCYGKLAEHIHAVETGLSSDPPMNRRVSSLDRYRLVSNSDAHSPSKLGREATVFSGPLSYPGLANALKHGDGYEGTLEFFPEEGKYHFDGHRKCSVCWSPSETRLHNGRCSVCGKPVTVGVMNRVEALADRAEKDLPAGAHPFHGIIPLPEILSELEGVGPTSKRVDAVYRGLLDSVGPELFILLQAELRDIATQKPDLAEALRRMREGRVIREAGYDGEFGTIRLFNPGERS